MTYLVCYSVSIHCYLVWYIIRSILKNISYFLKRTSFLRIPYKHNLECSLPFLAEMTNALFAKLKKGYIPLELVDSVASKRNFSSQSYVRSDCQWPNIHSETRVPLVWYYLRGQVNRSPNVFKRHLVMEHPLGYSEVANFYAVLII